MFLEICSLAFTLCNGVAAVTHAIPAAPPSGASPLLDSVPVSISMEFFTFPEYVTNISATSQCLSNIATVQRTVPALRIGGGTQDIGTWDPTATQAISYTLATPLTAPDSLTFGPAFISLAAAYQGETTLGLNRKENQQSNTIAAATVAYKKMSNLYAFELGNEPEAFANFSIAKAAGGWDPAIEASSEVSWQAAVGKALGATDIIQAGTFYKLPTWGIAELAPREGTSLKYVKSFSDHGYPQTACNGKKTSLSKLVDHATIVSYTQTRYVPEVAAAKAVGKILHIAETNSASCGGGGISRTFGAGLWIVDYVAQALIVGAKRLYFHHGTIGNCAYCWWDRTTIASPYYGAYFVAEALGGASQIAMLDDGKTPYAAYAIYQSSQPVRVLLYNSDYYTSGSRSSQSYTLQSLQGSTVTAKRLTAPSVLSQQELGSNPTIGGQSFQNGTCEIMNKAILETTTVAQGSATFQVGASEALLIFLTGEAPVSPSNDTSSHS